MNVVQKYLTEENNWLKDFILANYENDNISIAYGRFEIPNGYFNLGKRDDGLYAFFKHYNGVNSCDTFDTLDENKIRSLLESIGLKSNTKVEKEEPKPKNEPLTLFDFM